MIEAKELRIGNLVHDRGGKVLRVDYWERENMIAQKMTIGTSQAHPLTEYCEHLQPIPLTEEWLLKCGFEKYRLNPYWFIKDGICINTLGNLEIFSIDSKICRLHIRITFLHKLQNLYFALKGEELQFNKTNINETEN